MRFIVDIYMPCVSALKTILLKMSKKNGLTIRVIDKMYNIFHFTYINFIYIYFLPPIYTFSNNKMYMDIYERIEYIHNNKKISVIN